MLHFISLCSILIHVNPFSPIHSSTSLWLNSIDYQFKMKEVPLHNSQFIYNMNKRSKERNGKKCLIHEHFPSFVFFFVICKFYCHIHTHKMECLTCLLRKWNRYLTNNHCYGNIRLRIEQKELTNESQKASCIVPRRKVMEKYSNCSHMSFVCVFVNSNKEGFEINVTNERVNVPSIAWNGKSFSWKLNRKFLTFK
jgi:hypothetical protein